MIEKEREREKRWRILIPLHAGSFTDDVMETLMDLMPRDRLLTFSARGVQQDNKYIGADDLLSRFLTYFSKLEELTFFTLKDREIEYLSTNLRVLKLGKTKELSDAGLQQLVQKCTSIEHLELFGEPVTDARLAIISSLPKLRKLCLREGSTVTPQGMEEFVKARKDTLTTFRLPLNSTCETLASVCQIATNLQNIYFSNYSGNTYEEVEKACHELPKLKKLNLFGCYLAGSLPTNPVMWGSNITTLKVNGAVFSSEIWMRITDMTYKTLQHLGLKTACPLTPEAIYYSASKFRNLRVIKITAVSDRYENCNEETRQAFLALIRNQDFSQIELLDVSFGQWEQILDKELEEIKRLCPNHREDYVYEVTEEEGIWRGGSWCGD